MRLARLSALIALGLALGCGSSAAPPGASDFSIDLSPETQIASLPAGGTTTTYTVTTAVTSGAAESIALTISGLPAGVTGAFTPPSINGAGTSTLTLTIAGGAASATNAFIVTGTAATGTHSASASIDVCTPGPVSLQVTQTAAYACHQGYQAKFVVANLSCAPVSVTQVSIAAMSGTAGCAAVASSNYPLSPAVRVPAGKTMTVLDLMGANFCCTSSPCPAQYNCQDTFSYTVTTSAGVLSAPALAASIDLGGCTGEVCHGRITKRIAKRLADWRLANGT